MTRTVSRAGVLVLLAAAFAPSAGATPLRVAPPNGDIGGAGGDSTQGTPLPGGAGRGMRAGATVAVPTTHPLRPHVVPNPPPGGGNAQGRHLRYPAGTPEG